MQFSLQKNVVASPAVQKRNQSGSGYTWKMSCLRPAPPTRHYLAQNQDSAAANRRSVSIVKKPQKGTSDHSENDLHEL